MLHGCARALALLVVLLAPTAAAEPLDGALSFHDAPVLRGALHVETGHGALNLSLAAATRQSFALSWTAARGAEHVSAWDEYPGVGIRDADSKETRPLAFGAGNLSAAACAEKCKLYVMADGAAPGAVGLAGRSAGRVATLGSASTLWAGAPEPDEHSFVFPLGAGWWSVGDGGLPLRDAEARAEGRVVVLVQNLNVTVRADGRETHLDTRPRDVGGAPAGVSLATRRATSFVVLELEGARLDAPRGVAASLVASDPRATLEGTLVTEDAAGWVAIDGARALVERRSLVVEGDLVLDARTLDEKALPREAPPLTRAGVGGDARRVVVGSVPLLDVSTAGATERTAGAVSLVAALAILLALATRATFLLPLYSRIGRSRVLSNPNRLMLHAAVEANPGSTATQLGRLVGISRVVAQHHLHVLESHGLVASHRVGLRYLYYLPHAAPRRAQGAPADAAPDAAVADALLADGTRRQIAETVLRAKAPLTQREIAEEAAVSPRLASYHLSRLESAGLVRAEGARPKRYAPAEPLVQRNAPQRDEDATPAA